MSTEKTSGNIICRCKDITLEKFITCICDNDYNVLVTDGEATQEEKEKAFNKIYMEYCELTNNQSYIHQITQQRKALMYGLKELITYVAVKSNAPELLKRIGYNVSNYEAKLRRDMFEHELAMKELRKAADKQGASIDRRTFMRWVVRLSKYYGQRIDPKIVYLDEFIEIDRQYKESQKSA